MASISSFCTTQRPALNRRASQAGSPKYNQLQFGMHQQQAGSSNTGCFTACFRWIQNLFHRAPNPATSATTNTPLLNRANLSASQAPTVQAQQPGSGMDYGSFQLPDSDRPLSDSHPSNRHASWDSFDAPPIAPEPKPNRFLMSASGTSFVPAFEDGELTDTGSITLADKDNHLLGTAELKNSVILDSKKFHRLQLEINNPQHSAFELIDHSAVLEQLLKASLKQARAEGMALMIYPQDADQEILLRQNKFKPLAEVLKTEPPAKYKPYFAVDFSRLYIHERAIPDAAELVVGSPPGWREERRALQRQWEARQTRRTSDKKTGSA